MNSGGIGDNLSADNWGWGCCMGDTNIVAFKVTKEFKAEPREFWITEMGRKDKQCHILYEEPHDMYGYIHVREVSE